MDTQSVIISGQEYLSEDWDDSARRVSRIE